MGELSFVVITTYDSEEIATAAQQRVADLARCHEIAHANRILNAGWNVCKFLR